MLPETCCTATATYEEVRPNAIRRLIRKIPGVRNAHASTGVEKGFVPPKPLQDIQLTLLLRNNPVLQKKQLDLKATVDSTGHVTQVELLSPRDKDLLALTAYAANRWRFAPAELNNQPVSGKIILHFSFGIESAAQAAVDRTRP
jgi:TonB-like protein